MSVKPQVQFVHITHKEVATLLESKWVSIDFNTVHIKSMETHLLLVF